jgi:hypothetical protein
MFVDPNTNKSDIIPLKNYKSERKMSFNDMDAPEIITGIYGTFPIIASLYALKELRYTINNVNQHFLYYQSIICYIFLIAQLSYLIFTIDWHLSAIHFSPIIL